MIVEGHGEVEAAPVLLRRLASAHGRSFSLEVMRPIRIPKSRLLRSDELEAAVQLAARRAGTDGRIILLLDADDDCPKSLAPNLMSRVHSPGASASVVLANREFEAWFLAAARSLRGKRGLRMDLEPPPDPEAVRGAKEWLTSHMIGARAYSEAVDQPALAAQMDLSEARRAPSFDKFCREVLKIL